MATTTDSTGAAVVDKSLRYKKIDENTPRNQPMLVICKGAGVASVGKLKVNEEFCTHWFPLPTFDDSEDADQ